MSMCKIHPGDLSTLRLFDPGASVLRGFCPYPLSLKGARSLSIDFIVLCCNKVTSVARCFCIVYTTLQNLNKFLTVFTQNEDKLSIACFRFRLCKKSKLVLCFQYVFKKTVI